ncbi:urea ABC transporter ATP-binding protein UrtD [Nitrospirillum viridazoti]|uniref:Urea ABC transporter ATP-binding protein UrtD n=1 Tax=Nitrospirillum viridazoti CBAmc TaxID=1441467 RepID=A0A248JZ13_9PROT|nr:urea ABC transporter ATP-binding protein UrtD [Nitrospirillum amazonense]ASG23952.1 urea ABC transporter ATP-binding protein UrtD [Nitrospirillum amazonense CBAmc]TWB44610.1 urea transport system ATP-binding protein [Nitrospirillum amazonense]
MTAQATAPHIGTTAPASNLLLAVDGVTVDFDGFKALNGFSLTLDRGTLRVLIGPNGAGKSTLCDTIIGRVRATSGRVIFKGQDITHLPEHEIVRRGICRKFQTPGVLPGLSVVDNLMIAARRDRRWWSSFRHGVAAEEKARVADILETIGLADRAAAPAGQLAHGEKQWLEIGMVVATRADLLLLDEPTAGMGPAETSQTAALIRRLVGQHTVLVIDHDMSFLEQLDARVTVMHQGQFLKEGSVAAIRADADVAAVYLGRAKEDTHHD